MIPLYFSSAEIELLENVSPATARRRIAEIKARFDVKKYQKISIVQYSKFSKMKVKFVILMLEKKLAELKK